MRTGDGLFKTESIRVLVEGVCQSFSEDTLFKKVLGVFYQVTITRRFRYSGHLLISEARGEGRCLTKQRCDN